MKTISFGLCVMVMLVLALSFAPMADAKCGGGKLLGSCGRVGIVQQVRDHRQLHLEHRVNNMAARHSRVVGRSACAPAAAIVAPEAVPAPKKTAK